MLWARIELTFLLLQNNALTVEPSELYGEKETWTLTFVMQTQKTTIILFPLIKILQLLLK